MQSSENLESAKVLKALEEALSFVDTLRNIEDPRLASFDIALIELEAIQKQLLEFRKKFTSAETLTKEEEEGLGNIVTQLEILSQKVSQINLASMELETREEVKPETPTLTPEEIQKKGEALEEKQKITEERKKEKEEEEILAQLLADRSLQSAEALKHRQPLPAAEFESEPETEESSFNASEDSVSETEDEAFEEDLSPSMEAPSSLSPADLDQHLNNLLEQLRKLKKHVDTLPADSLAGLNKKSSDFKKLQYAMQRRIDLIQNAAQSQDMKNKLETFSKALTHFHPKLLKKFDVLPPMKPIKGIANNASALGQFKALAENAVINLDKQRQHAMATAPHTVAQVFSIAAARNEGETNEKTIERVTREYLGIARVEELNEIRQGRPPAGVPTKKVIADTFRVCNVATESGERMGFVEVQTEHGAVSKVAKAPDYLLPEKIWAPLFSNIQDPQLTQDQFDKLLPKIFQPYATEKDIKKNMLAELKKYAVDPNTALQIYASYKTARDAWYLPGYQNIPNKDLIRLAISQSDGLQQMRPGETLILSKALSEADAKAKVLYARSQGYEVENLTKYKNLNISEKDVKIFRKILETDMSIGYFDMKKAASEVSKAAAYQKKM